MTHRSYTYGQETVSVGLKSEPFRMSPDPKEKHGSSTSRVEEHLIPAVPSVRMPQVVPQNKAKTALDHDISGVAARERRAPFSVLTPRNARRLAGFPSTSSQPGTPRETPRGTPRGTHRSGELGTSQQSKEEGRSQTTNTLGDTALTVVSQQSEELDLSAISEKIARFQDTIVDRGYKAIQTIGTVAAGFATTLDTAIEQLVSSLGAVAVGDADSSAAGSVPSTPRNSRQLQGKENTSTNQDECRMLTPRTGSKTPRNMNGRRSTAKLPSETESDEELCRLRKIQREYLRLRESYNKLQADLRRTQSRSSYLTEENNRLKQQLESLPDGDPLADQVREQLQTLLAEKARLAQENDQLMRQNNGLQELLDYSTYQQQENGSATSKCFQDAGLENAADDGTAAAPITIKRTDGAQP